MSNMKPMGEIFTLYGSDKNTHHAYGSVYEKLLPDRNAVRSLLEVGIASGQSVMAWRDIFPNARIVGIDKEPCHNAVVGSEDGGIYPVKPRPDRLEIQQADIRDTDALLRAVGDRKFDVIVEDSSHVLNDNLRCLWLLWPHVAPGGIYIIEEMDGVHSYSESFPLWNGAEIHTTGDHKPGELIVAIRKPL